VEGVEVLDEASEHELDVDLVAVDLVDLAKLGFGTPRLGAKRVHEDR